jgi:recombination protein RecR
VANDADKAGIEMAASFSGIYYVLHGTLSPIDGVGPQELGILDLMERVSQGSVSEIVLALDEQLESEATVHYISEQIKQSEVQVTRVQFQNMKSGSLDKVESHVIEKALAGKQTIGFEHD